MVLKLEDVSKRFGSFTAVDNLSIAIPEKEMFGFWVQMVLGKRQPSE